MQSVRHCGSEVVISVGHSLFIRQLLRRLVRERGPGDDATVEKLTKGKVDNCGVVRLELDYSDVRSTEEPRLTSCQLMFGTVLHTEH